MLIFLLVILFVAIGVALVVGMVMPKDYSIAADIVIDRGSADVYEYIRHIRHQEKYSKWVMQDPDAKMEYTGTDGTVGFISRWDSKDRNVGAGEQEITKIMPGLGYEVEIRFKRPFEGVSRATTIAEPLGPSQTRVTNTFYTYTAFPMNLLTTMIRNMLKKDMDITMGNLKRNLESRK